MPDIAVLREDAQRPLLAAAPDENLRAARLDGTWDVERPLDPVVLAFERRPVLREHQPGDGDRLFEPVHPLADGRKLEAVTAVLILVPRGTAAHDGATLRDDV